VLETIRRSDCDGSAAAGPTIEVDEAERSVESLSFPIQIDWCRWSERPAGFDKQWQDLADRALPGKAYLSPRFVSPAVNHLKPRNEPVILSVSDARSSEIALLAIADKIAFSSRVPFAHLRLFKSIHSFMTGLVHSSTADERVIEALFRWVNERGIGGIEMLYRLIDTSSWNRLLEGARRAGFEWVEYRRFSRAVMETSQDLDIDTSMTSKRRKAFRSSMRSLASQGTVEYRVVVEPTELIAASERFMELEDKGWKHDRRVSLRSNPKDMAFFREMFGSFADARRARVCELLVGSRVVASTVHLISNDTSFAFKLGWDPEFAKQKVGVCQQILTAQNARRDFGDVAIIDSCTEDVSFFEKLWPGRRQIASGVFVRRGLRAQVVSSLKWMRQLKQFLPKPTCAGAKADGDPCGH
jgi:CelD/BcsL family acetyltransferase involved in cellulose biosynthesis